MAFQRRLNSSSASIVVILTGKDFPDDFFLLNILFFHNFFDFLTQFENLKALAIDTPLKYYILSFEEGSFVGKKKALIHLSLFLAKKNEHKSIIFGRN